MPGQTNATRPGALDTDLDDRTEPGEPAGEAPVPVCSNSDNLLTAHLHTRQQLSSKVMQRPPEITTDMGGWLTAASSSAADQSDTTGGRRSVSQRKSLRASEDTCKL
jgi:hypothetical protein